MTSLGENIIDDLTNNTSTSELAATATKGATPKKRRTPTEKQIEALKKLDDEALLDKATEAMHALNRRAKKLRDTGSRYYRASFAKAVKFEKERIYSLKDTFLVALAEAGVATLYTFVVTEDSGTVQCQQCGNTWKGWGTECYRCGGSGESTGTVEHRWFIIERGPFRFHAPNFPAKFADQATKIEPHDPTQPARQIPDINLTIAAQFTAVNMAVERLNAKSTALAA